MVLFPVGIAAHKGVAKFVCGEDGNVSGCGLLALSEHFQFFAEEVQLLHVVVLFTLETLNLVFLSFYQYNNLLISAGTFSASCSLPLLCRSSCARTRRLTSRKTSPCTCGA